ncbi:hypothetical protein M0R45_031888 [Rubus argutus]|uniref:Uncharacterized protein n=1 Tax=Rubus argutus TaxID=59490 RepID=A0AAW1WI02_RUBAR
MDNVLDEWNTQALKQQIEEQENECENVLVIKKKTIKQLNISLTSIAEERQRSEFLPISDNHTATSIEHQEGFYFRSIRKVLLFKIRNQDPHQPPHFLFFPFSTLIFAANDQLA